MQVLADRWFDGERLRDEPVVIECVGERITRVRPLGEGERPSGQGADTLDARGKVLAPGLVNAHVHLARGGMFKPMEPFSLTQSVRNLRTTLAAGVTTVGDMGCAEDMARTLRRHVRENPGIGPSFVASGPVITAPKGYPLDWMPGYVKHVGAVLTCASDAQARGAAQRVAEAGMDHVKVMLVHQRYTDEPLQAMSLPVVRALVEEAHRLGLRAFAHAVSRADYALALDAGVDAIMHSSFEPLDAEAVRRVRDGGVSICPTLWVFESVCLGAEGCLDQDPRYRRHVGAEVRRDWTAFREAYAESGDVIPDGITTGLGKEAAKEKVRVAAANLRMLHAEGVPIGFGNDAAYGFCVHGRPVDELLAMERAGLSSLEVLRTATSGAAELLGCADRGRIAAGQRADLVVFGPAVLTRAAAFEHVYGVVAGGRLLDDALRTQVRDAAKGARAVLGGAARTLVGPLRRLRKERARKRDGRS